MDLDDVRERMRRQLHAPAASPLEATRKFLHSFVSDEDSLDSVRASLRRMASMNTRSLDQGLAGIEGLLANPPSEAMVLSTLVAYDAGWSLEENSDAAAKIWLQGLANMLREELTRVRQR